MHALCGSIFNREHRSLQVLVRTCRMQVEVSPWHMTCKYCTFDIVELNTREFEFWYARRMKTFLLNPWPKKLCHGNYDSVCDSGISLIGEDLNEEVYAGACWEIPLIDVGKCHEFEILWVLPSFSMGFKFMDTCHTFPLHYSAGINFSFLWTFHVYIPFHPLGIILLS